MGNLLPKDIFCLTKHLKCDNAFLAWNKFSAQDGIVIDKRGNGEYKFTANKYLKSLESKKQNNIFPLQTAVNKGIALLDLAKEQEMAIKTMEKMNLVHFKSFKCKQEWHMIVGIGGNTVSEVGMTLHFINGVPFIPGQSIKGWLRHCIVQEHFQGNEGEAYKNSDFTAVFGTKQNEKSKNEEMYAGNIIFYDAYPTTAPVLVKDIMTNHNGNYYKSGDKLTDTEQPNPVTFLCIKNTEFVFYFGVRAILYTSDQEDKTPEELLELVTGWFVEMLEWNGLGAKTSVGYGYLTCCKNEERHYLISEESLKNHKTNNLESGDQGVTLNLSGLTKNGMMRERKAKRKKRKV